MAGGDVPRRGQAVARLVVEEHVGFVGAQELGFVQPAEEQALVQANVPGAQRLDDALVRRRAARGDERGADRAVVVAELALQAVQPHEERFERPALQRAVGGLGLRFGKRFKPFALEDLLGMVGEQHRVAIEGDLQAFGGIRGARGADQRRGRHAVFQCAGHVLGFGGKKQVAAERLGVAVGAVAGGKRGAHDFQPVRADGVEDAQAGVGGVAREQNHVHAATAEQLVDAEQLVHEREALPRRQRFVFALDLVAAIRR